MSILKTASHSLWGVGGGVEFLLISLDDLGVFRSFLLHQGVDYKHKSSAHSCRLCHKAASHRDILTRWVRLTGMTFKRNLDLLGKLLEGITFFCAQISKCLRKFALFVLASSNFSCVHIIYVLFFYGKTFRDVRPLVVAHLLLRIFHHCYVPCAQCNTRQNCVV